MSKEPTCQERINQELQNELTTLRILWAQESHGIESTEKYGSLNEHGLSFDYHPSKDGEPGYFQYCISTGGPADEFRFFIDPDLVCYRIDYWFLDWYDGAHVTLKDDNEKLLLEIYNQWFLESGTCQYKIDQLKE